VTPFCPARARGNSLDLIFSRPGILSATDNSSLNHNVGRYLAGSPAGSQIPEFINVFVGSLFNGHSLTLRMQPGQVRVQRTDPFDFATMLFQVDFTANTHIF
jgi:hypothetical protein